MSKFKNANENVIEFEKVAEGNVSATYKPSVNPKGRSPKDIRKLEASLPTTTLHYFDKDDFANLKRIEAQLSIMLENNIKRKRSILEVFYRFLEIK